MKVCPKYLCLSTVGHRSDLFQRDPNQVLITDFFGAQKRIEMAVEPIKLPPLELPEVVPDARQLNRPTLHYTDPIPPLYNV